MGSRRSQSPPWQIILEEMRSQNRATLEAVLTFRSALEDRLDRVDRESRGRDEILSLAIKDIQGELRHHGGDLTELKRLSLGHSADIAVLKEMGLRNSGDIGKQGADIAKQGADIAELKLGLRENTIELRSLSQKVDALNRLEDRVAALEKRAAGPGTPSPA